MGCSSSLASLETAYLQSKYRFMQAHLAGFSNKSPSIFYTLQVESQHARMWVGGYRGQDVGLGSICLVPQTDQTREPKAQSACPLNC